MPYMTILLNSSFLITLFLSCSLSAFSQASALTLYSYKDVAIVFPKFCKENFVKPPWGSQAIDTITGFGIEVDGIFSFSPNFKIHGKKHRDATYLPAYSCHSSTNKSSFNSFVINVNTDSKNSFVFTLNISNIELWHWKPALQKGYPLLLNHFLDIKLSEDEFIAIVNIQHSYKCENPLFEGGSIQVNIYKLIQEVDLKSLIEWAEFLSKNIEFYSINCTDFNNTFLNYFPCETAD